MKRALFTTAAVAALAAVLGMSASAAAPRSTTLLIHHQVKGCHAWSLNGGTFKVSQTARLAPGGSLVITNTDVMPHQLVKLSGGTILMKLIRAGSAGSGNLKPPYPAGLMPHMGSALKVVFAKAGTYTLITKTGEDYIPNVKTVGEDNVLRLKVIVA